MWWKIFANYWQNSDSNCMDHLTQRIQPSGIYLYENCQMRMTTYGKKVCTLIFFIHGLWCWSGRGVVFDIFRKIAKFVRLIWTYAYLIFGENQLEQPTHISWHTDCKIKLDTLNIFFRNIAASHFPRRIFWSRSVCRFYRFRPNVRRRTTCFVSSEKPIYQRDVQYCEGNVLPAEYYLGV